MSISETISGAVLAPRRASAGARLSWRTQLLFAAAAFAVCLAPAVINGFPIVFPDTEGYLIGAEVFRPQIIRAFGYSAFIGVTGGLLSLWLTAAAQAALTAWLVTRVVALDSPRWPPSWRVPAVLVLFVVVVLSHAPWLAAWIQPDLFTGLMLLTLFLLIEHSERLWIVEKALLFAFLIGSATVHLTHPPLLAGAGAFSAAALAVAWWRGGARNLLLRIRRTAVLALVAASLGWAALGVSNYITYRSFSSSVGGSVFLFARLAADADMTAALRPECEAGKPWIACRFLDRFNLTSDEFLWRGWSPLMSMGYTYKFMHEANEINPVLIRRVWPEWLAKSAGRTVRQIAQFELGNGMDDEGTWMLTGDGLRAVGQAKVAEAVLDTLQATDELRPLMPSVSVQLLATAGLLVLAGFVVFGLNRRQPELWWPALVFLIAYLGNAALVSLGSDVFARYAARLVWVAPLLAALLVLRATSLASRPSIRATSAERPSDI